MALHTYTDLVRGPDRPVLDCHPVDAGALVKALALRTARQRVYLPFIAAVLLLPVGIEGNWVAWIGGNAVVFGGWCCALAVGYAIHLLAVWSAFSPSFSAVLDLLRGPNPRMQAALIYAPGAVLFVVGVALLLASAGVSGALQGWSVGWWFLLIPPGLGVISWLCVPRLADRHYVAATALLSEVDGAWAAVDETDAAHRVYLDWLATNRPELLRALRNGWRRLRMWPMLGWLAGFVALFAGWSDDPAAGGRVVVVAGAAVLAITGIPCQLSSGDPPWLDRALGIAPSRVAVARGMVAWLYAQGVILPCVFALCVRQGFVAVYVGGMLEVLAFVGACVGSAAALTQRGRGMWMYGPAALLLWAFVAGRLG